MGIDNDIDINIDIDIDIVLTANFLIYFTIFITIINAIQEGLAQKRLPLTLFCLSLHSCLQCSTGHRRLTDRDVREKVSSFHFPLSAIPTHSPTLWSINRFFENIANIRYFQKNRWSKRCKRSMYQSSAQGMKGPQSTKGLYRSQGPYCPKCAHKEKP